MKFGIIVVVVLFISAFGAHFLLADPGYVVINFRGYVIEMSVPVLAGLTILLLLAVWIIRKIIVAPRRLGETYGRHRAARSGKKLTRGMIEVAALGEGGVALQTIVAPGDQACDCHDSGTGPIREGELIVVDIFPRRPEDGYWGDMTRTFLKGKANDDQRRMVRAVRKAEQLAIGMIKPGVTGGSSKNPVQLGLARA